MKTLIPLFLSLTLLGCIKGVIGVNVDSLNVELKTSVLPQDSLVILKALTKHYQDISFDSTYYYGQISIGLAGKLNDTASLAFVYNSLGLACLNAAFYEKALEYYQKSEELYLSLNHEVGLAAVYNNMGIVYTFSGKNDITMEYYNKSLEIWRNIYKRSPDDKETKKIIAILYNNIGIVNFELGKIEKALGYYKKSLNISREVQDKKCMSNSLLNIGIVNKVSINYDKALECLFQANEIAYEIQNKHAIANSFNEIGNVFIKLKNYKKARKYFNESLQTAKKIPANELIIEAYQGLFLVNKETRNPDTALQYLSLYHQLNDSIYSQESKNKIAELQNKYEFEKKEQAIILLEAEQELKDNKLRNGRIWLFVLIGGITISLFLLGLIYFQMNRKKRANIELVRKNKEIVKSEEYVRERLKSEQQNKHLALEQNQESKYAGSPLSEEYKEDLKLLITNTIENKKLYLKSDLTIAMLSKHLDVSRTYISQVINEKFNINFNAFVNEFRINEARRMLLDKSNKNFTIEAMGKNLGFGSNSSFYAAFKKHTGVTPAVFMKYLGEL